MGCKSREENEFLIGKGCKQSVRTRGGRVANKPKDGFLKYLLYLRVLNLRDDIILMITNWNAQKKAGPFDPAFLQLNLLCVSLFLKLSPGSRQTDQAKTEKKHSGRFGDRCVTSSDVE